ncbi:MAG TPA: ABC transporter ATP-binding protein [Roseiflexaceae bacterium]|nr:ABC transporter ATP-binding protein [Roseiflexaceae bacterium]HMP40488.1 ABC transporter ATP-binding protein [Roseiflexaceae bacterium]
MLSIIDLQKAYGTTIALAGVSLDVAPRAIVAILGPSGCGKSTLLRLIAGLEAQDGGSISYNGRRLDGMAAHQRGFGLMFQEYALFPHLDVAANIAFGLRMQHVPPADIAARVDAMLALVGLNGYGRRRIDALSGGERQRVALARSLAPQPQLIMLDEPLAALDRTLRERLVDELGAILRQVGVSGIYVTHDQAEAFAIADELVLMQAGRIEQRGTPAELYRRPATRFVARFLGLANQIEGQALGTTAGLLQAATPLGTLLAATSHPIPHGTPLTLVIRPEAATMLPPDAQQPNTVMCSVEQSRFLGSRVRLGVRHAGGMRLTFDIDTQMLPTSGSNVLLYLHPEAISVIP